MQSLEVTAPRRPRRWAVRPPRDLNPLNSRVWKASRAVWAIALASLVAGVIVTALESMIFADPAPLWGLLLVVLGPALAFAGFLLGEFTKFHWGVVGSRTARGTKLLLWVMLITVMSALLAITFAWVIGTAWFVVQGLIHPSLFSSD
jgi:hypothetical protein